MEVKLTPMQNAIVGAMAGTFSVNNSTLDSSSFIYKRNTTGNLTVTQSYLQGSSGIDASSGDCGRFGWLDRLHASMARPLGTSTRGVVHGVL